MWLLLINTCGTEGVVALAQGDEVTDAELLPGRGTSETLVPAVRRLLRSAGIGAADLGAIGVVVGPGSFTGVRVGLSAAKGLCDAGGAGMVAMSRLALLARDGETLAVLDAGRGEFFCGLYRGGVRMWEDLLQREALLVMSQGGSVVTCEPRVQAALCGEVRLVREPGANEMLAMVRSRIAAGHWSDVAATDANYLRRTDAELLKLRQAAADQG